MAKIKRKERERTTPPARYTSQIVLLVSDDAEAAIRIIAREKGLSKAAVTRSLLYGGLMAAGYTELAKTDDHPEDRRKAHEALAGAGLVG